MAKRIGLPGLGARLRDARKGVRMSQERVGQAIGVSWMTVHRWEHDQRTIKEDKLEQISELYAKPVRWFLTMDEGDLDLSDPSNEAAKRIYRIVISVPIKYHSKVEKMIDNLLKGLESVETSK